MRIETDLLGSMEVEKEAYYGIQTLRAVKNFPITHNKPHRELIKAVGLVKGAAAKANLFVGSLGERVAQGIIQASQEVAEGKFDQQFIVDVIQGGAGTSFNMNANEVIANRAIEILGGEKGNYDLVHPNSMVNMAQSTNDVLPTTTRIACLNLLEGLVAELIKLQSSFAKKAEEFDGIIKMGRTHLQDAIPIRLGQEFAAYGMVLERDGQRIKKASQSLKAINMGATAVGTGLNADLNYIHKVTEILRRWSGFDLELAPDLVDATQNTDAYLEVSGALKILAVNLSKIANDLRLMASGPMAGLNEINLPPVQPGSSIMPGKVNPVMAEVVNQVAFQVQGNDHTITLACGAGQLELNVMEPVIVYNLVQSIEILRNVMQVFGKECIDGITANGEHCRKTVENSVGIVTAVNPVIGYDQATEIAKEALKTDKTVRQLILEKGLLTDKELDRVLDPFAMTEPTSQSIVQEIS